jgi:hypothetical protein
VGWDSWRAFYQSELQGVWALLPVPVLLIAHLLASPRARRLAEASPEGRFVHAWSLLFAAETLLDPLVGGKLVPMLGAPGWLATAALLVFVLLGDFRVYWLVFALALRDARRGAWLAAAATPAVPLLAFAGDRLAGAFAADASGLRIWLLHELLFTGVALWLRGGFLPRRVNDPGRLRFLRAVCAYVILYYALWAACDALWMAARLDLAWLLRVLPNQLYYAFFVPFVWWAWSRRG